MSEGNEELKAERMGPVVLMDQNNKLITNVYKLEP